MWLGFCVPGVAVGGCGVQHGSVPGRFPKTRERRAPRLRGAGRRGRHGREDTGRGVPPSGIGGVFAGFDGRAGGESGSIECRARRRCVAVLARGRPGALSRGRGGVRRAVFGDGGAACGDRGGVRPFASADEGGAAGRRGSGSGRHRDVGPRRPAGRRGEVLRGAARGVRRRSSAPVLPALRSADGPSRPGREDVRDALRTGPGRTAPFPLPRVRRQLFPFGPGAGSGRQEPHARRGKPLCGRRQFRQLRAGAPPTEEFRRRGGSGVDSPAPCLEARRRPARRRPSSAARPAAWTRRPGSRCGTRPAVRSASASTARRP